jgi:hypothetical protein
MAHVSDILSENIFFRKRKDMKLLILYQVFSVAAIGIEAVTVERRRNVRKK